MTGWKLKNQVHRAEEREMVVLAERNLGRELNAGLLGGDRRISALLLFNYSGLSLEDVFLELNNCYRDSLLT